MRALSVRLYLVAVLAAGLWTATPAPADEPSTAGRLLVAGRDMPDNPFRETVILMITDDETGALGLVINRVFTRAPLGEIVGNLGLGDRFTDAVRRSDIPVTLLSGGPVEPELAFLLHDGGARTGSESVAGEIGLSSDLTILEGLPEGRGPKRLRLVLGYAGWAPGQLAAEFERGDWETIDADPDLIFDSDARTMWDKAIGRVPIDL